MAAASIAVVVVVVISRDAVFLDASVDGVVSCHIVVGTALLVHGAAHLVMRRRLRRLA